MLILKIKSIKKLAEMKRVPAIIEAGKMNSICSGKERSVQLCFFATNLIKLESEKPLKQTKIVLIPTLNKSTVSPEVE